MRRRAGSWERGRRSDSRSSPTGWSDTEPRARSPSTGGRPHGGYPRGSSSAGGPEPFYGGETAGRISEWVVGRGGTRGAAALGLYEPSVREPVQARYSG